MYTLGLADQQKKKKEKQNNLYLSALCGHCVQSRGLTKCDGR